MARWRCKVNLNRFAFYVASTLLFSTVAIAADSYDPTNDLFFAFGSKCKGKGPINSTAFNEGAGLKHILEGIRDDASCKGVTGALADIENLNIPQLLKDRDAENDLEYMSMQANDLELAIQTESKGSTPDAVYVTALKEELVNTKVNIAKSKKLSNQEKTRKRLETIENYQKYSNVLFSRLKQSDQCLTKNPNLSAQIGAQVLGLGSTLASGLVGSLMLATGNMIDNFVSFFREKSLGSKIKGITNNRLGEAIGCSFEGLSNTYCQARDVETVINFNKNKSEPKGDKDWLEGIGIVGQDSQAYLDWVTQVKAGSPAGTTGQASDKKTALALENELRSVKIDIDGLLNTAKRTVSQSPNKTDATRKALNDLAAKITPKASFDSSTGSTTIGGGPFGGVFNADTSCGPYVYLYSKGVDRTRKDAGQISCTTYVASQYPNLPDINTEVGGLIDTVVSEATQDVNIQLSQVNESNPNLVLSKADSKMQNRRSAREFLNSAVAYLNNLLADPTSIAKRKNQRDLIEKTKTQIENSLVIMDKTLDTIPATKTVVAKQVPADPAQKIADISKELIPQGDTFAIPKALSEITNQDIDQRISLGQIDENLAVLMQLSSNDSLSELIKYYIGLEAAKTQSRSSKELTKSNLTALGSIFSENLAGRMEKLSTEAKQDPDANESLALLCMQSLAVPESPKIGDIDVSKYCSGKVYQSIYNKSGIKMDYSQLSMKSYPERACSVYDFYRKSYLYGLKTNRGVEKSKSQNGIETTK